MYLKVYSADTSALKDPALQDRLINLLPQERREKTDSRKRAEDKAASLAAGLLLSLATERMGLPGADEYIKYNAYGKPYYDLTAYERVMHTAVRPSRVPQVYFNISHSRDRVMCAVSDAEVGCDVELIRPEVMHMAHGMLHPFESGLYEALADDEERQRFFFRRWAVKESYVKAAGTGYTGILPRSLCMKEEHYEVSLHVDVGMTASTCTDGYGAGTETAEGARARIWCPGPASQDGKAAGRIGSTEVRRMLSDRESLCRFYEWDLYDGYRYACCVLAPDEETLAQLPDEEPELIQIDLAEEF